MYVVNRGIYTSVYVMCVCLKYAHYEERFL